jgi:hypothetical protein
MSQALPNFEGLLREALAPVEPPEALARRLEGTLLSLTELAAEELEAWELSAMRDPRNWARPAAAVVVGGAAGAALVLLRARQRQRSTGGLKGTREAVEHLSEEARGAAQRTLRDLGDEARRLLGDR